MAGSRGWRLWVLLLGPTAVLTAAAKLHPALFELLRRDPSALLRGEWWRCVTPVLIQADILREHGLWQTLAVLMLVAALVAVGERWLGTRACLLLYAVGTLVGHGVGELWQPYSAGCSVAGCGVLGGLSVWLLRARPLQLKLGAALVLVSAGVGTLLADIHGPPLLAGALVGLWGLRRVPLPQRLA